MSLTNLKNGQALAIRVARVEDAARIVEHGRVAGGESDGLAYERGQFPISVKGLELQLAAQEGSKQDVVIVGLVGDELVGVAGLFTRPGQRHVANLSITVRKAWWRLGVGSAMVSWLVEWPRGTGGIRKLQLDVKVDNARAIGLYEKMGFEIEGRIRRALYKKGIFTDLLTMGLFID